jgi:CheY-like chemotaxis protein
VRIGRQTCALRPVARTQLSIWRCGLDRDTCGPPAYPVFVRCWLRNRSKPDDNEPVADSLAFLLDCHGHQAAVAYDGETALRLLRTGAFEITVFDENLPDIKGGAVAWSLRETPNADSLRGFPRFNDGRRCRSGRHCPALRCLFAKAVLLRPAHAGLSRLFYGGFQVKPVVGTSVQSLTRRRGSNGGLHQEPCRHRRQPSDDLREWMRAHFGPHTGGVRKATGED